ncbi:hypothetical protein B0H13DRAFT_1850047 [Mycena leptocephala]|nr:hypothetical protein B0H13DRAFT_1850047 [Mycena leptocephala]
MEELSALGIETLVLNVTDIDAIRKTKEEISQITGGKLDILMSNTFYGNGVCLDISDVRALFELHLFAPMSMVQEFLPLRIASGKACVMNTGGLATIIPAPFLSAYNASKAALHSFGNTLPIELAPFNIRVVYLSKA